MAIMRSACIVLIIAAIFGSINVSLVNSRAMCVFTIRVQSTLNEEPSIHTISMSCDNSRYYFDKQIFCQFYDHYKPVKIEVELRSRSLLASDRLMISECPLDYVDNLEYSPTTFSTSLSPDDANFNPSESPNDYLPNCNYDINVQLFPNAEFSTFHETAPCDDDYVLIKVILCEKYGRLNPSKIEVVFQSRYSGTMSSYCPTVWVDSPKTTSADGRLQYFYDEFGVIVILFVVIVMIMVANMCIGDHWKRKRNETAVNILHHHMMDNKKKLKNVA